MNKSPKSSFGVKLKRRLSFPRKNSAQEDLGVEILRRKVKGSNAQASSMSEWNKRFSTL